MNQFSLEGKHIVISGASSGIGKQCAISCSSMGARISLIGRNEERLTQTLNELEGQGHNIYQLDLTIEDDVKATVNNIVKDNGLISGLLNVAGISNTLLLRSINEKKLDEMFRNNVYSSFFLTKEVCRKGNFCVEGGSIVFYSSIVGSYGDVGKSLYAMSKGALLSATKSLACELSNRKIRVNAISPGVVITPINENLPHIANPEKRTELENKHLLGLGKVTDVANASIFLLSDASRWITGVNLFVDGGYTAK